MKNLKITIHLVKNSPLYLNRFTTIDSILLSAYYGFMAKNGRRLAFDSEHKTVDFIEKKHGVFSGSVWYIDKSDTVHLDFSNTYKRIDTRKVFEHTGEKVGSRATFKGAMMPEEIMLVDKIHFYIRGEKEKIEALLEEEVTSIGKKQKLGFGQVAFAEVEEIKEDKGYLLNETTASKPLPVSDFQVKSKKIAFFPKSPPYSEKKNNVACYMPTTALFEHKDNTFSEEYSVSKDLDYVSNVDFVYNIARDFKGNSEAVFKGKAYPKKGEFFYRGESKDGKKKYCAVTQTLKSKGVHDGVRAFMSKWRAKFSDYHVFKNDDFISEEALWAIANLKQIGYSLVEEGDKEWKYLQGGKSQNGNKINDYIVNHTMFRPPFSINLKDTQNAQHVLFEGKVSTSNAFYFVQYGKSTLQIDVQMLREAIKDIQYITKKHKNVSKTHLCGNFKDGGSHPFLKKGSSKEDALVMIDFHRKYDVDLRRYLNSVSF